MNRQQSQLQPGSYKARFARGFLRALIRINKHKSSSSTYQETHKRSQRIKGAADASMALAVSPRRAWTKAMLHKIRRRRALYHSSRTKASADHAKKRRRLGGKNEEERADKLRRLVPGGEAMDICSLLEETAHYIKCLTTQVQVMEDIADFFSA